MELTAYAAGGSAQVRLSPVDAVTLARALLIAAAAGDRDDDDQDDGPGRIY